MKKRKLVGGPRQIQPSKLGTPNIDEAMNEDHSHGGQNDGAVYGAGETEGGQNECEGGLTDGENECEEDGRVEAVVRPFGDDEENKNYRDTHHVLTLNKINDQCLMIGGREAVVNCIQG
ncbi:hypothetical protein Bca52824_030370 [Brassica carinata]|uniref:Uncharacterized protein n=1 Tax=Brassica carinata TaxID=52824 RepID=A0A8X7SD26_BRACI|nr:hypothetical protein Bca52824_030370 [Brassica carinata]